MPGDERSLPQQGTLLLRSKKKLTDACIVAFVMLAHISTKSDEFSRAATQSWLWLTTFGGVIALFTLLGTLFGLREMGSGLLHFYQTCRGVLESNQQFVSAVVSSISLMAFASTGIGILSCIAETWSARALVARLRGAGLAHGPVLSSVVLRLGLQHRVTRIEDHAAYALTAGFLRPQIYVSSGLLDLLEEDELEAVLWHEFYHALQRDPLRRLIGRALRRALFFLPVAADLWARHVTAAELAADGRVVAAQGRDSLVRALLKILDSQPPLGRVASEVGVNSILDLRIAQLLDPQAHLALPHARRMHVAASIVVTA
ncbi:MAG: M56 family metallopeptidase, partial [bacterium]